MSRILGIAGTAKNTGKTTTLHAVIRYLRGRGTGVFLTSIGYDGEDVDTVTGLPKPKVVVEEGDMVATALPLLTASPARFSRATPTGVSCALGPIYTGVATSPGKVVLAGPVSTKDVETVLRFAPKDRAILLDGAFSRLAPMVLADTLIFATGAARSADPRRIAAEMEALATVFGLPVYGGQIGSDSDRMPEEADLLRFQTGLYVRGLDEKAAAKIAAALGLGGGLEAPPGAIRGKSGGQPVRVETGRDGRKRLAATVSIDGVVNPTVFSSMAGRVRTAILSGGPDFPLDPGAKSGCEADVEFVLGHPIFMLLSGDIAEWKLALDKASSQDFRISVARKPELIGFTVNPFRPEFDPIRNTYAALYVDAGAYLKEIRGLTGARCTDIVYEGTGTLEAWLGEARVGAPSSREKERD